MHVIVTSDVLEDEYDGVPVDSRFAREYLSNADNLVVPGVTSWNNVQAHMPDPATVVIEADLVTQDVVPSGDWKGQEVSEDWVRGYIEGADAYWLAPGTMRATKVTFS